MREFSKGTVYLLLLLLAAVFTYSVIVPAYFFPSAGVACSLAVLSTVVYFFFSPRNSFITALYTAVLGFCLFIFVRANGLLTFFNIAAVIYVGAATIVYKKYDRLSFPHLFFAPFIVLADSFSTKAAYTLGQVRQRFEHKVANGEKFTALLVPVMVTIGLLVVILPLLSYANPIFGKLVNQILSMLNLAEFIKNLFNQPLYIIRIIVFGILLFFLPRLLTTINEDPKPLVTMDKDGYRFAYAIPKAVIAVILAVFFVTQMQLYFASPELLQSLGYTNSRLTNEVFGQLAVVISIIFVLVYNDKRRTQLSEVLTYILLLEGLFLGLVAAKSDYDYMSAFGFTIKRLYGVAVLVWLVGMYAYFTIVFVKHVSHAVFTKFALLFTCLVLLGINIANFDYLIYHYAKSRTGEGIDNEYLARLSTDADSYADHLAKVMATIEQSPTPKDSDIFAARDLLWRISQIQDKYSKGGQLRTLNLSDYQQYRKLANINTAAYHDKLDKIQNINVEQMPIPTQTSTTTPMR